MGERRGGGGGRRGYLQYAAVCFDSTKFFVHNRETAGTGKRFAITAESYNGIHGELRHQKVSSRMFLVEINSAGYANVFASSRIRRECI